MLINYRDLKSAGIYTFEVDNTTMPVVKTSALRMLIGWNPTGPFNVPVFVANDRDRRALFGDIDPKFEDKGAFLNRSIKTALQAGPVFALNLLPTDNADKTNYAVLSLDSAKHNPDQTVSASAEQNRGVNRRDKNLLPSAEYRNQNYGGFVGVASFPDLFDRVRFWNPSPDNLLKIFRSGDDQIGTINDSNVRQPLLGFGNTSTKDVSLLVFKPGNLTGYDVTVREWYGGEESIPYKWLRPTDYISDYFIQVVAIQGIWSNFQSYAADPYWSAYFTDHGVKYDTLREFMSANSITQIGSWTGCIIPDFVDHTGASDYIINKINNSSLITGITATLNVEALNSIDLNLENNKDGGHADQVFTNPDFCVDHADDLGSAPAPFQIDLVGHNRTTENKSFLNYNFLSYNFEAKDTVEKKYTGSALLKDVRYFGDYNTIVIPQQDNAKSDKTKADAIATVYKNAFIKKLRDIMNSEKGRVIDMDYLGNEKFSKNEKSLGSKLNHLRDFAEKRLGSMLSVASAYARKEAGVIDNIAEQMKSTPEGRSVNAFNDLSETSFMFNMSSSSKQISSYEGSKTIGALKNRLNTTLIPGLTHVSNIQTVDYDTLCNLNANLKGDLKLSDTYLKNLKKKDKYGKLYKVITCIDPVLLVKGTDVTMKHFAAAMKDEKDPIKKLISEMFKEDPNEDISKDPSALRISGYFAPYSDKEQTKKNEGIYKFDHFGSYYQVDKDATKIVPETEVGGLTDNYEFKNSTRKNEDKRRAETILEVVRDIIVEILDTFISNTDKQTALFDANQKDIIAAQKTMGLDPVEETPADKTPEENPDDIGEGGSHVIGSSKKTNVPLGADKDKSLTNPDDKFKVEGADDTEDSDESSYDAVFQYPINSSEISKVLRFIPLRGLELKARHMPGFDRTGCRNLEDGIDKIYSMIMDPGIFRGLTNPDMIDYRYIVDTMAGGLRPSLGGKVYLSRLAKARGKCTALLNAPSIKSMAASTNPYFCDVYNQGSEPKPPFDSKYVPLGGNKKMIASNNFSLMDEGDGATYAGVFTPFLKYVDGVKSVLVPPAADVSNTFIRKFNGGDPYAIVANTKGVLSGSGLAGLECALDKYDRDQFEPMGLNSIIQRNNQVMIYSNRTAYQRVRSDFNFLHVRELLNTIEIEVEAVLQNFVFEYNNAITRGNIITLVNPILSTMRDAGALYDYDLEFNETPDDSAMIGDEVAVLSIGVVVNKGMEKIVQVISVNKRGKIKLIR